MIRIITLIVILTFLSIAGALTMWWFSDSWLTSGKTLGRLYAAKSRFEKMKCSRWWVIRLAGQIGAVSIESIIMIFVAIVIIYQLIPNIGTYNTAVQSSANTSTMAKFAASMGEWLFPLLGIIAVVFILFRRSRKSGSV